MSSLDNSSVTREGSPASSSNYGATSVSNSAVSSSANTPPKYNANNNNAMSSASQLTVSSLGGGEKVALPATTTTTTTTTIIKPVLSKTSSNQVIAQSMPAFAQNAPNTNKSSASNLKSNGGDSLESLAYSDEASLNMNNPPTSKYENANEGHSFKKAATSATSTTKTSSSDKFMDKENSFYTNNTNNGGSTVVLHKSGSGNCGGQTTSSISELAAVGQGNGGSVGGSITGGASLNVNTTTTNTGNNNNNNNNNTNSNSNNNNTNRNNTLCNNIGNGHADNENTALCQSPHLTARSLSNSSNRKEKKTSVGYRLGKRKLLFEKRRKISDYALIFAMTGVFLMIIETEFSMSKLYNKVELLIKIGENTALEKDLGILFVTGS